MCGNFEVLCSVFVCVHVGLVLCVCGSCDILGAGGCVCVIVVIFWVVLCVRM